MSLPNQRPQGNLDNSFEIYTRIQQEHKIVLVLLVYAVLIGLKKERYLLKGAASSFISNNNMVDQPTSTTNLIF